MKRRTILSAFSVLALPLGGCLDISSGDSSCIRFREFSSEAQAEIRTAVEAGEYNACGNLKLLDEINLSEDPLIRYEETTYEPVIAHGDAGPQAECSSTYTLTMEQSDRNQGC